MAKEYHPDINPNNSIAEEYFKKINEAYSVLNDPIKRSWYNLLLKGNAVGDTIDRRKYGTRKTYTSSTGFSEEESSTPFWLKQMLPFLSMTWCLLIIFNNWFTSYQGPELAKMVFAFLLFIVSAYFFINNLYNKWRKNGTSFNPENRSLTYFILLFFLTIPAFFILGYVRKTVQLKWYPALTEATVVDYRQRFDDYWLSVMYFDEYNLAYTKEFEFKSGITLRKANYKVLVKYSTHEPRIVQYHIQLTGKDSIYQETLDRMNEGGSYYK